MLRIFRGERHAEGAAQPGQREEDAGAQARQDTAAESAITPPHTVGNGQSALDTQELAVPAAPAGPPASSGEPDTAGVSRSEAASAPSSPAAATSQHSDGGAPSDGAALQSPIEPPAERQPGFLDRGRMRRRARFLRAARELAYRDLGGLVFDLHRFGARNDEIVQAKLDTLARIDTELRTLESTLRERSPVTVLREAGVAACPRCAAIHGSGDRFCPTCGLAVDQAERPIAAPNAAPAPPAPTPPAPSAGWPIPAPRPAGAWPEPLAPPAAAQEAPPLPPPAQPAQSHAEPVAAMPPPGAAPPPGAMPPGAMPPPGAAPSPEPDSARAALPAAPGLAQRASDPPTEVIRSGLKGSDSPQRTVAFDPISQLGGGREGDESAESPNSGQDRR